jgi:hypothetical protein
MKSAPEVLKIFIVWRILLFIPILLGGIFLNYGSSYPFFEITYYQQIPGFLDNLFLKPWANFDGVHYLNIALRGYIDEARFFPLFPLTIYISSFGSFNAASTFLAGLTLPNIFTAVALYFYYKLLRIDYEEKKALSALVYLLVFPTAFFLAAVYSEGLFFLLLVLSFYFARKQKWEYAATCGLLLCATRFVGVFIIPALAYEYFKNAKSKGGGYYLRFLSLILIPFSGLLTYALYNQYKWGSFFYFLTAHTELGNSRSASALVFPLQTVFRYFKILFSLTPSVFEWWVALLELSAFVFGALMLYIAWKKSVRISYLLFAVPAFLLPSLSGTFSGLPRYLLIIFPVFLAVSLLKSHTVKRLYVIAGSVLLFVLLMFFTKAYFIS